MMPGMPAFWAPAGPQPQPRRLTWGRARAPEAPETAAQKEQPASQPGNANATKHRKWQRFVAGVTRARARQKARKQTRQKQGPSSTRASHSKSKTDRTHCSFWRYLQRFVERGPSIAGMPRQRLAPKCAKMSLAYIPPIPSKKQCFMG